MDSLHSMNASAGNESFDTHLVFQWGSYQPLDSQEFKIAIPVILGVICALGSIGNLTAAGVLVSNARHGKLSLINSLILNLVLADGLVLVFSVPIRAAAYSRGGAGRWTPGWLACKSGDGFLHACLAAKSFTIAIMAKACYRYVCNPTKQVSIRYKTVLLVPLFTWLLAGAVSLPHWLFATLEGESGRLSCVQVVPPNARSFMSTYAKLYPLLTYCSPLSFALLYFWRAYSRCRRRSSKTQNLRTQMRSRKLTLMLFSLTVTTATMWLPQWVSWVWTQHATENEGARPPPALFSLVAQLLAFSISMVNPLIILALSEEFRESYKGLWRRLTLRTHPPKPKQGPHAPTAPKSPCPRPETAAHRREEEPALEQEPVKSGVDTESPHSKDGAVLPDVEQFWQERETGSLSEVNDPVPWEHQDMAEVKQ